MLGGSVGNSAPTALYDAATSLLNVCVASLSATGAWLPHRRFVAPPQPVPDCDSLTVFIQTGGKIPTTQPLSPPPLQEHKVQYPSINQVTFMVSYVTCAPTATGVMQPAHPKLIDPAAELLYTGIWAIYNGIQQAHRQNQLFGPSWNEMRIDQWQPLQQLGGVVGYYIPVTANPGSFNPLPLAQVAGDARV